MHVEFKGESVLWGAIGGGLICLASAAYFFSSGKTAVGQAALFPTGFFLLSTALILLADWKSKALNQFLIRNERQIRSGEAHFQGIWISGETRIVRFKVVLSLFFVNYSFDSMPHLYLEKDQGCSPWVIPS